MNEPVEQLCADCGMPLSPDETFVCADCCAFYAIFTDPNYYDIGGDNAKGD